VPPGWIVRILRLPDGLERRIRRTNIAFEAAHRVVGLLRGCALRQAMGIAV
jgi:hypothetical protein